jgi:hypothetical protein
MDILYELKDLLCEELEHINKKHDFSNMAELEVAYKAVDIIKDISTIEAMENSDFSDYSYDDGMMSNRGRGKSYDGGYSGRRNYGRGGRSYNARPMGYSGAETKEQMMQKIDEMQRQLQQM